MNIIKNFIDVMLHLDHHLNIIIQNYGMGTYLLLFIIIFCETGLVVTPFLPGDSLLFAAGAFASLGSLNIAVLFFVLGIAAVLGDTVNYVIGRKIGGKLYRKDNLKFIKKEYLDRTRAFYERHGGKTIIIARFIPIIRTFAPFVAGIGEMSYLRFISYNIVGGLSWTGLFTLMGYYFGNLPAVKSNFTFVIFAIILLSILPGLIGTGIKRFRDSRE
jgi:membrane-associated protein